MAKVKCRYCKKEIDKETAYSEKEGFYYCNETCHINHEQDKRSPKKAKKDPKPLEGSDMRKLTDYIQELLVERKGIGKERINWEMIIKQAKNIMASQEDNCTYATIHYVLWYMVEIAKVNVFDYKEGSILNLVPYYIREAKQYYFEMQEVKKSAMEFEEMETKIITPSYKSKPKFKKITFD